MQRTQEGENKEKRENSLQYSHSGTNGSCKSRKTRRYHLLTTRHWTSGKGSVRVVHQQTHCRRGVDEAMQGFTASIGCYIRRLSVGGLWVSAMLRWGFGLAQPPPHELSRPPRAPLILLASPLNQSVLW